MASNRQERLQMRQRGAGTRKIQAVDFGFSFGSPTGGVPASSITQQIESVPETTNAAESIVDTTLPNATAPVTEQSTRETPTRILRNSITPTESPRRSSRISIGRIPTPNNTTEEQEEGRSSKRRRISTKNDDIVRLAADFEPVVNPSPVAIREDGTHNDEQNGVDESGGLPDTSTIDVARDGDLPENIVGQDAQPQAVAKTSRRGRPTTARSQENRIASPEQTADQARKLSSRQSQVNGSDPPDESASDQDSQHRVSRARSRRGFESQSLLETAPEVDEPEQANPVIESSSSKRGRRRKELERPETAATEPETAQKESVPESSSTKRGRRRQEPEQPQPGEEQQDEEEGNQPTQKAPRGRRKRGRPSTAEIVEAEEVQEGDTMQIRAERKGKNRAVEPDERPSVDQTPERDGKTQKSKDQTRRKEPQEIGESSQRRGRPSLGKGQERQPEAATETTDTRAESSSEPDQPAKRRRGRPSAAATEDSTTSGQRTKRRREQDEGQEPRRREGTVAITVHRLANTHILDSTHATSGPSDDEQDSSDELEAVGKNFPSRNGVNAADVLSQICKEILDKHLTTLDNNIANDASNQAKRSEYARQRKTIEAYGTQLEGRLFELSELLDSNFSLAVQLKKARREAAEMRNRLLEVRQQRHEITLRMDAVRRKHGEEEDAKMSRNAINNTLHNLDLTLDRNRNRVGDEDGEYEGSGVAGLEFLLRSVSENVSSAAEGSYGGLLSQVKAFNTQLEMTVRKLEP